eukprot:3795594-Rhodomonas_salina.7
MQRLQAMGIGDSAVEHMRWISGGGNVAAQPESAGGGAPPEPAEQEGLVLLKEGRVHWAGCERRVRVACHALHDASMRVLMSGTDEFEGLAVVGQAPVAKSEKQGGYLREAHQVSSDARC